MKYMVKWATKLMLAGLLGLSAQAAKRNVVFILIDDLGHYGVTAYGSNKINSGQGFFKDVEISTPRIDRLAQNGMLCTDAYAYPLCEPTRIALMSGMNNNRNFLKCKAQHQSDITFGDLFNQAGYITCITGKWKQSRGTKEVKGKDYIFEFGWDEFCCFDVVGEGSRYLEPNLVINGEITHLTGKDPETGRRWYGPDVCNRFALDFIDRNKDKPFFLYYPMLLVHDEHTPTPDTKPASVYDDFATDKPSGFGHGNGDDRRYFPDMIAYTDKLIGKVLDKLEEHHLAENTLVVIMGDNGTKECFEHILPDGSIYPGGKGGNTENGIHVPLLLRAPGDITAGKKYTSLVNLTDLYPTICEAAGITPPNLDKIDGISFWPQATGKKNSDHRKYIYTWYNGNHSADDLDDLLVYAFTKKFKRYAPHKNYPNGRFFDLRTDRLEQTGPRTKVEHVWNKWHHAGLDPAQLTREQLSAYKALGKVLKQNAYVPVSHLKIVKGEAPIKVGQSQKLTCRVSPENATRQNIIWESDKPEIASIDKFGNVTAHKPGTITATAYSWDDANPTASNAKQTFRKDGIHDIKKVSIVK